MPTNPSFTGPIRRGLTALTCALACALALGACARSIGQPLDVDAAERLRPGHSTYQDAVAKFGKATRVKGQGNHIVAHWHYLKDTAGGTEYDSLKILFDENGRMVRIVERLDSDDEDER
jgi:hypothetical protein